MIVCGVLLVVVGVTASAQAVMVSVHSSASSLNATIQSDLATLRGFFHQGAQQGLDASIADPAGPTPEQQERLQALISTLTAKGAILRVDLRTPDGRIVASSEAVAAGSIVAPSSELAAAAASNQAHVAILAAEQADTGATLLATSQVLREYLPLSHDGQVLLVVAMYRDAVPILSSLDDLRREVVLVIISGALIAAGVLFFVFRAAQARISRQTAALVESSRRDALTGMLNHGALVGYLAQEMERARSGGRTLEIALIDVDNFRLLNDTHGHRAGDETLRTVARLLSAEVPAEVVLGRYGPDELLVIRPADSDATLTPAIESLRLALREVDIQYAHTERMPVTVSAGLCAYPDHGGSVTVLLAAAARTLEEAKASGGDAVRVAGAETESDAATSSFDVLQGLVFAVDTKDRYTRRHSQDVARYAVFLGQRLGLGEEVLRTLHISGLLHDVGKIGIPDHILRKPGRLTEDEALIVQQHVALGDMIVRELPDLDTVRAGIRHHHERWDGRGYLAGLRGGDIPLVARILSVADTFSAMTTTRPYRKALDVREALVRLGDAAGTQLDEDLVREFVLALETAPDAPLLNVEPAPAPLWVPRLVA